MGSDYERLTENKKKPVTIDVSGETIECTEGPYLLAITRRRMRA